MIIVVNGVTIPLDAAHPDLNIQVTVSQQETLPQATVNVTGGHLDVYRSKVSLTGDISVHMFSEGGNSEDRS